MRHPNQTNKISEMLQKSVALSWSMPVLNQRVPGLHTQETNLFGSIYLVVICVLPILSGGQTRFGDFC